MDVTISRITGCDPSLSYRPGLHHPTVSTLTVSRVNLGTRYCTRPALKVVNRMTYLFYQPRLEIPLREPFGYRLAYQPTDLVTRILGDLLDHPGTIGYEVDHLFRWVHEGDILPCDLLPPNHPALSEKAHDDIGELLEADSVVNGVIVEFLRLDL